MVTGDLHYLLCEYLIPSTERNSTHCWMCFSQADLLCSLHDYWPVRRSVDLLWRADWKSSLVRLRQARNAELRLKEILTLTGWGDYSYLSATDRPRQQRKSLEDALQKHREELRQRNKVDWVIPMSVGMLMTGTARRRK